MILLTSNDTVQNLPTGVTNCRQKWLPMTGFRKHIFICTNQRDGAADLSCEPKGGTAVQVRFKERLKALGINIDVRANKAGCLDACQHGVVLVIYPDALWYGGVTVDDVDEIIEKSIVNSEKIERLVIKQGFTP